MMKDFYRMMKKCHVEGCEWRMGGMRSIQYNKENKPTCKKHMTEKDWEWSKMESWERKGMTKEEYYDWLDELYGDRTIDSIMGWDDEDHPIG